MYLILFIIIYFLFSVHSSTKLRLLLQNSANKINNPNEMNKNQEEDGETVTYITLLEGSKEIYSFCQNICEKWDDPLLYTEVTSFTDYGDIYRCQCGAQYSKWYDMKTHEELSYDILLGDDLFNDYLNMLGFDDNDCYCASLKNLLYKLIMK
jgi:hypothetical protein